MGLFLILAILYCVLVVLRHCLPKMNSCLWILFSRETGTRVLRDEVKLRQKGSRLFLWLGRSADFCLPSFLFLTVTSKGTNSISVDRRERKEPPGRLSKSSDVTTGL